MFPLSLFIPLFIGAVWLSLVLLSPAAVRRALIMTACGACVLAYITFVALYASSPVLYDCVEGSMIAVSSLLSRGGSIYHSLDNPERYTLMYGPAYYVTIALFFRAFGASIAVAKAACAVPAAATPLLVYSGLRREGSAHAASIGAACCAILLLQFGVMPSWLRTDPFLIFWTSVSLYGCRHRDPRVAAGLCGLAVGLSVDLKMHGPIYLLPALVLLYQRHGIAALAGCLAVSVPVAALPFIGFRGVSLQNHLLWLREMRRLGFDGSFLPRVVKTEVFLLAPCVLAAAWCSLADRPTFVRLARSNAVLAAALVAAAALLVAPSLVAGAGPHHLLPLIPTLSFLLGLILARSPGWGSGPGWRPRAILVSGIAYALAATGSAAFAMREDVKLLSIFNDEARQVLADIEEVCSKFPDSTIAMGCGGNATFRSTFYRAVPVFKGHPYLADPIALMAMKKVGLDVPPRTLDALASGETAIWLIPAGDDPFSMQSQFKGQAEVYNPAFRRVFREKYDKVGRTKLFDVWSYSPSKPRYVAGGPGRSARAGGKSGPVALGDRSPKAPTDPDVPN
jgi:hypothetical protein